MTRKTPDADQPPRGIKKKSAEIPRVDGVGRRSSVAKFTRRATSRSVPKHMQATVRRALRQAWEIGDADKAENPLRNLARRLEGEAPGVAASILEGLDEMLTVNRLCLPPQLRRSLYRSACLPQRRSAECTAGRGRDCGF
jgi:hypothetical protein